MIRVFGDVELYVDVDRPTRTVRLLGPGKVLLQAMLPGASSDFREYLTLAEWMLEGVPGEALPAHAPIAVDMVGWFIIIANVRITAVQSEHLRALLQRAEDVLRTGVGDMTTS